MAIVNRYLSAQAGGTKALRFDMGTRCGARVRGHPGRVRCPGPHAEYKDNFRAVAQAVRGALGDQGGPRNAIVLADALSGIGIEHGLAETITGAARRAARRRQPAQPRRADRDRVHRTTPSRPARARAGSGPRASCTRSRTRSARSSGARRTPPSPPVSRARSTATAGRARTSCVTPRTTGAASQLRNDCAPLPGTITRQLRLRPRRLLQPRAGARQLPRHPLEHVRLGVHGRLRHARAGLRRRGRGDPGGARPDDRADDRRAPLGAARR